MPRIPYRKVIDILLPIYLSIPACRSHPEDTAIGDGYGEQQSEQAAKGASTFSPTAKSLGKGIKKAFKKYQNERKDPKNNPKNLEKIGKNLDKAAENIAKSDANAIGTLALGSKIDRIKDILGIAKLQENKLLLGIELAAISGWSLLSFYIATRFYTETIGTFSGANGSKAVFKITSENSKGLHFIDVNGQKKLVELDKKKGSYTEIKASSDNGQIFEIKIDEDGSLYYLKNDDHIRYFVYQNNEGEFHASFVWKKAGHLVGQGEKVHYLENGEVKQAMEKGGKHSPYVHLNLNGEMYVSSYNDDKLIVENYVDSADDSGVASDGETKFRVIEQKGDPALYLSRATEKSPLAWIDSNGKTYKFAADAKSPARVDGKEVLSSGEYAYIIKDGRVISVNYKDGKFKKSKVGKKTIYLSPYPYVLSDNKRALVEKHNGEPHIAEDKKNRTIYLSKENALFVEDKDKKKIPVSPSEDGYEEINYILDFNPPNGYTFANEEKIYLKNDRLVVDIEKAASKEQLSLVLNINDKGEVGPAVPELKEYQAIKAQQKKYLLFKENSLKVLILSTVENFAADIPGSDKINITSNIFVDFNTNQYKIKKRNPPLLFPIKDFGLPTTKEMEEKLTQEKITQEKLKQEKLGEYELKHPAKAAMIGSALFLGGTAAIHALFVAVQKSGAFGLAGSEPRPSAVTRLAAELQALWPLRTRVLLERR